MRSRSLPTLRPAGLVIVCGAIGFVAVGMALGYRSLVGIGITGLVVTILAALTTLEAPRLDVSRAIEPLRVERGRAALGLVSVRNIGTRRSRPCLAIERVTNGTARSDEPATTKVLVQVPDLRVGRSVAVTYELPTQRRGALQVGPLAIAQRDPFGLWEARRPIGDTVTLLVQPRIHSMGAGRGGRTRHLDGPTSDKAPRGTSTFHSLREYTPGDDIRRVHWRTSARTGTLMVREHVDTGLPSRVVVLDTRAGVYAGDQFEEAVDVAASVVSAAQDRGFPVRLITSAGAVYAVRAGQRGQELRDFLTTVTTDDAGSLRRATVEVVAGGEHDQITIVSGDLGASDLAEVTAMTQRFAVPLLVTVGAAVRWTAGQHFDGQSATSIFEHWNGAASDRQPVRRTS
jgi:uncharacterized protein (DUF58 family)